MPGATFQSPCLDGTAPQTLSASPLDPSCRHALTSTSFRRSARRRSTVGPQPLHRRPAAAPPSARSRSTGGPQPLHRSARSRASPLTPAGHRSHRPVTAHAGRSPHTPVGHRSRRPVTAHRAALPCTWRCSCGFPRFSRRGRHVVVTSHARHRARMRTRPAPPGRAPASRRNYPLRGPGTSNRIEALSAAPIGQSHALPQLRVTPGRPISVQHADACATHAHHTAEASWPPRISAITWKTLPGPGQRPPRDRHTTSSSAKIKILSNTKH